MKKFIISLFIIGSFISCNQDNKPPKRNAFLFFKLGSNSEEIKKELKSLVVTGGLKIEQENYYWSNEIDDEVYYYTPIFLFPPGDSLCTEMKLLFFDQIERMPSDLTATKNNEIAMNLMYWDIGRVKSWKLRDKIVENISAEHGPFTKRDTVRFTDNQVELTSWKDKNGVDITVRFRFNPDQLKNSPFAGNSSLTVTYSFTKEIMDKNFKSRKQF